MTDKINEFFKKYYKTLLFFAIVGLVGGFFVGLYSLDSYPEEIKNEVYAQGLNDLLIGVVTAVQSAGYGIVLGAVGILLGTQTGLFKGETKLERRPLLYTLAVALVGGAAMILFDLLIFGRYSEVIMDSYKVKPTIDYLIASVLYGGVIEEVMLRLFMLSLVVFVLWKLLGKGAEKPSVLILVLANLIAALLFAAGHLPATAILMGITPTTLIRCFLLNGGLGFLFGWLYYKHGLRYSMLAHAGCHVVSKLIWILFI